MRKTYGSFAAYIMVMIIMLSATALGSQPLHAANETGVPDTITEWKMLWEQPGGEKSIDEVSVLGDSEGWFAVRANGDYPAVPDGVKSAWIKLRLPELTQMRPAMDINDLYAKSVSIYIDGNLIYQRDRQYSYDQNDLLVPLGERESLKDVYVHVKLNIDRMGLYSAVDINEHDHLLKSYIQTDLLDVVLGAALIFIAFFMMVSIVFLKRAFLPGWNSVFLVMLSIGVMILTYSSFLDKFFPQFGGAYYIMFDIASSILLPSLFFFFEQIFGKGPYGMINKFKNLMITYAIFNTIMLSIGLFSESVQGIYMSISIVIFGISIVLGNLLIIATLIHQWRLQNKEAIIISAGIGMFAGAGLLETIWYFYRDSMYEMFFWKISILCFLASLIIILVRRIMHNYEQAVQYSKQIEIFNNELQRSEKIELISNLAASIAHEVRNPLQVTRGFLQLIGEKMDGSKDKNFMTLAVDELDRASEIITDFLTFAKPDLGEVTRLNLSFEVNQIVAILSPLATMQGGVIRVNIEQELYVRGNASRFKQALINIIKNSIEAFEENGEIKIAIGADDKQEKVIIRLIDNGEGMDEADLKRLGEPYYSNKSKGTGLGLMVTFRIIEAMNGEIIFYSTKGVGTEACIQLPKST